MITIGELRVFNMLVNLLVGDYSTRAGFMLLANSDQSINVGLNSLSQILHLLYSSRPR
jgi:hypothetical protein